MINFLIALNFAHRGAVLLEEYICRVNMAYYGQIRAIKDKCNQIGANKAKYGSI